MVPGRSILCHYPNKQDAALLFYHDHTIGINRLNNAELAYVLMAALIVGTAASPCLSGPSICTVLRI